MPETRPPLSVIVATIQPWPEAQPCLDRLLPQLTSIGGELVLADGTSAGCGLPPDDQSAYAGVGRLSHPGSSVFALRARGAEIAKGECVAFTEDHCVPAADWVARIRDAHAVRADAAMVTGAVLNGSADGVIDWANFLMTFAEFLPPLPDRALLRVPPMGNCSFRRSVLLPAPIPEGWLELVLAPTLLREGRLHVDDRIVVSHVQPRRLLPAIRAHFDNGRSSAGLAVPHMARRDWRTRLLRTPALPWWLFQSVMRSMRGRTIPRRGYVSVPAIGVLCAAHTAGELTGLLLGEGSSAKRLN